MCCWKYKCVWWVIRYLTALGLTGATIEWKIKEVHREMISWQMIYRWRTMFLDSCTANWDFKLSNEAWLFAYKFVSTAWNWLTCALFEGSHSNGVIFARNSISIISISFKAYIDVIDIFKSILEPKVYKSPDACLIHYIVQKKKSRFCLGLGAAKNTNCMTKHSKQKLLSIEFHTQKSAGAQVCLPQE